MRKFLLLPALSLTLFTAHTQNCPPNIGFENGNFSNWKTYTANVTSTDCNTGGYIITNKTQTTPIALRHTVMTPNSAMDPFGNFPITPNGNPVLRLGYAGQIGAEVEQADYSFRIPSGATQYSISYQYALVHQAPLHCHYSQPHFAARVFNVSTNQYIACATNEVTYSTGAPDWSQSPNASQGSVMYRSWTPVTINLSGYAGDTVRLEFLNADCTHSGHWAYAYIDVMNHCDEPVAGNNYCQGQPIVLTAPQGYQNYQWWNHDFSQAFGNAQQLGISSPVPSTVYALTYTHPNNAGCKDTFYTTIQPLPAVTANAGADNVVCASNPTVTLGSPAQAGLCYSWSPASGLNYPDSAQPTVSPSITTSYILTVTDCSTGCQAKDTVTIYVPPPTLAPTITQNGNTLSSNAPQGNQWYLNGTAIPGANAQTYTPTVNGTYTVVVSANGCTSPPSNAINFVIASIHPLELTWKLQVFPNPVASELSITHQSTAPLQLDVYDVMGRRIYQQASIPFKTVVDLSSFASGAYVLRISNTRTKEEVMKKIAKQ